MEGRRHIVEIPRASDMGQRHAIRKVLAYVLDYDYEHEHEHDTRGRETYDIEQPGFAWDFDAFALGITSGLGSAGTHIRYVSLLCVLEPCRCRYPLYILP
jgi:hypothetical protein